MKRIWLGRQLADHLGLEPGMLWVRLPPELSMVGGDLMSNRATIIERMKQHADAIEIARAYLANGDHANWQGFRPLFGDFRGRFPHRDWVKNVFLRRRSAALTQCEKALETLEQKMKERQINLR